MKKRTHTIFCRARNSELSTGVEICEYEKRNGGPPEGRIAMRFFQSDNAREQVRVVLQPVEAYDLFVKINQVARSTVACKESTLPHKVERTEGDKKIEIISSVVVEKWVREGRSGYAIIGSRVTNGKSNSFNVAISEQKGFPAVNRLLFIGELLRFLSSVQSWEIYEGSS